MLLLSYHGYFHSGFIWFWHLCQNCFLILSSVIWVDLSWFCLLKEVIGLYPPQVTQFTFVSDIYELLMSSLTHSILQPYCFTIYKLWSIIIYEHFRIIIKSLKIHVIILIFYKSQFSHLNNILLKQIKKYIYVFLLKLEAKHA